MPRPAPRSRDAASTSGTATATGHYSLYSRGVENENYLRGVQETDANGTVRFTSIYPACYSGRWPHIHFEVYEDVATAVASGPIVKTSQIALPAETNDLVYATSGYEQSVRNASQVSLQSDNVFRDDGGIHQIATMSGSRRRRLHGVAHDRRLTLRRSGASISSSGERVRVGGFGMLEAKHLLASAAPKHDLDLVRVVEPPERAERAAQQLAQLVLVRQPQRILERDRVERPLGRAVEGEELPGRILPRLDRHLAHREHVGLELGLVELEPVARQRVPHQARVTSARLPVPSRSCQPSSPGCRHAGATRRLR